MPRRLLAALLAAALVKPVLCRWTVLRRAAELTQRGRCRRNRSVVLPGQMGRIGAGEWRLAGRPSRLPHSYTLQAVEPAAQA
jgi:hypothetical protein